MEMNPARAEIYWIPGVASGRLGIMARPRAGDWLDDEVRAWVDARLSVVVSLLEESEVRELALAAEAARCQQSGIEFVQYPIPDRGTPRSMSDTIRLVEQIDAHLRKGSSVAIHCRAGIGRSGLIAACVLVNAGVPHSDAFTIISRARGVTVPDTTVQVDWLAKFRPGGMTT